jgi:crotonobetainyl-CoA:carnitine CoA-transferase CaiB-like acyl-CoA transferase
VTGLPLTGLRVLDFGRYVAAPYCAMVLGDMGAEVIRVERPGGEDDRRLGLEAAHGETFTFASLARGKKSVTLDLRRTEPAREVVRDLVARSDVLLHNFGPAAAAALGLAYEDVRPANPALVYAGISFSGTERIGFDMMAQMGSGAAALTGSEGEAPLRAGVPWVDYGTGLSAVIGILLALRQRDLTGEGQAVDCALLQTAVSFTAPAIAEAVVAGRERPRLGNQPVYVGPSNLYRCRDGHVYLAAITSATWRALTRLIGSPDLGADPALRTPEQRFEQRERLDGLIERWTEARTVAEVLDGLERAHVPGGPYVTTAEVADDPQVRDGGMLGCVDLGAPGFERVPVSRTPVRLSSAPPRPLGPPPRAGEHNDEVYGTLLGYAEPRLTALRAAGVI